MLFSTQTARTVEMLGAEAGIRCLAAAGYPALDFSFFFDFENGLSQDEARMLRATADDCGVIFNQAHAPYGGGYEKYTTEKVPTLPAAFAACAVLGVRQIVVHPLQRGRYYGHERELFDMNVAFYRSLAPFARENGLKIGIENMWQRHPVTGAICDDVCANPLELAEIYDTLNDPDTFTVCLDIGHVALCGREPEDAIRLLGHDRLGALHVHDVDYLDDLHTLPGLGKIKWDAVTDALAGIDYKGELTLEADAFVKRFTPELLPEVTRLMAARAKQLADEIDAKRN